MLALLNQGGNKLNRIRTTESQVKGSNELKLILNIFFKSYSILNENISNLTYGLVLIVTRHLNG